MEKKHQGHKFVFQATGRDGIPYTFYLTKIVTNDAPDLMLLVQIVRDDDGHCVFSKGYGMPRNAYITADVVDIIINEEENFKDVRVPEFEWEQI